MIAKFLEMKVLPQQSLFKSKNDKAIVILISLKCFLNFEVLYYIVKKADEQIKQKLDFLRTYDLKKGGPGSKIAQITKGNLKMVRYLKNNGRVV